jgi:uncharacterized membrane protein
MEVFKMELFADGFLWRFLHVFFGIIWIGTLYYFNFIQTPFMGQSEEEVTNAKPGVFKQLLPRALWWFRWGAMFTFLTGLALLYVRWMNPDILNSAGGVVILLGALLGITMFLNVWLIIWPKQKIVIAAGGPKTDEAKAAAARAAVASRTNALFSIPMLFMMTAAGHFPLQADATNGFYLPALGLILAIYALAEGNAIFGKMVKPLATVKSVVTSGFVLLVVYYVLLRSITTI